MRGMSLLEVLVAFAILALALGVLYRAIGGGARNAGDAEAYQRAVILGQSILASRDGVLPEGWEEQGSVGRMKWSVISSLYSTPASTSSPSAPSLYQVDIQIDWPGEFSTPRSLHLSTLRPVLKMDMPGVLH